MIILRLFSKKEKDKEDPGTKEVTKVVKIGTGLSLISSGLKLKTLYDNRKKSKTLTENEKEVLNKFKSTKNVNILNTENPFESSTVHPTLNKKLKEELKNKKNPTVQIGKDMNTPGVLAHELGHAHHMKPGAKMGVGKVTNHPLSYSTSKYLEKTGGSLIGLGTGLAAAKKEHDTGEKESKGMKYSGALVSGVSSIPVLLAEGSASKKGLELLKKSGADKATMKSAKKGMAIAGATYALGAAANVAKAQVSHEGGKWLGKKYYEYKDKKKKND